MTNTSRCVEYLEVKLSEMDKVRAGARLADLCAKKDAAVAAKQSAMSHHAAQIKEIDEAIQQATGVVIRGYERRPVDCEWRYHDPREGYKTLYRLDLGEAVTVEEMTFADKQGSLFPEGRAWPLREPDGRWGFKGAKMRDQLGAVDAWYSSQRDEAQGPRTWPQPNGHGVYSDADAEVLKPEKLPKGAKAEIQVLQVGPAEWITAYRVDTSVGGRSGPLMRGDGDCYVWPSREGAIMRKATEIVHWVQGWLAGEQSKAARAQLLSIGTWAKDLVVEMDQAIEDAEREAVADVIASQLSEENGNGLGGEFEQLEQAAAVTAQQAVAAAEQHCRIATGAMDW